jgi:hypothetical protein
VGTSIGDSDCYGSNNPGDVAGEVSRVALDWMLGASTGDGCGDVDGSAVAGRLLSGH